MEGTPSGRGAWVGSVWGEVAGEPQRRALYRGATADPGRAALRLLAATMVRLRAPPCALRCARPSLASLVKCEVFTVTIAGSSRSKAGGRWGNPLSEALLSEGAGRSASKPDSASKHKLKAVFLPEKGRPDTHWRSNQHAQPEGPSGVIGGSARRETGRGTWETLRRG